MADTSPHLHLRFIRTLTLFFNNHMHDFISNSPEWLNSILVYIMLLSTPSRLRGIGFPALGDRIIRGSSQNGDIGGS